MDRPSDDRPGVGWLLWLPVALLLWVWYGAYAIAGIVHAAGHQEVRRLVRDWCSDADYPLRNAHPSPMPAARSRALWPHLPQTAAGSAPRARSQRAMPA